MFFTDKNIVLHEEEILFIRDYFQSVSERHDFQIMEIDIQKCSVKLNVSCKTTHYIPNIMKALKGGSARFLYKEFPDSKQKNGNSLWDQKYFIATENEQLEKMFQDYIKERKKQPEISSDNKLFNYK
jgi:putative transposase